MPESELDELPTGGTFNYATADYFTPKGSRIEGIGVAPDIRVKKTRRALIEGLDTVLDKAIAILSDSQKS
jgi:C-terminal processing protease CtpA/Prc